LTGIRYDLMLAPPCHKFPGLKGITHVKTALHAGDPCPDMHVGTNMLERCGLPLDENGRCPAGHQSVLAGV